MCVLISDYLLPLLTVLSSFLSTASDSPFSLRQILLSSECLCGGCFVMSLLCVAAATVLNSFLPLYLPLPFLLENAMTALLTYTSPVLHMVSWSPVQSSHEWTGTVQRSVSSTCSGSEVWSSSHLSV